MNTNDLINLIKNNPENESLEFKSAMGIFSIIGGKDKNKSSLYAYCVGIGNSGGGKIIFGVNDDREIVGTSSFENTEEVKSMIYKRLGSKIIVEEHFINSKRVVLIIVPNRELGKFFKFYGIPLTRVGEELVEMKEDEQRKILNELDGDFSADVLSFDIDVLDKDCVKSFKKFYKLKNKNNKIDNISDERFLTDVGLFSDKKINVSSALILGKVDFLNKHFPDPEIIFEYRNKDTDIKYSERVNYRGPLINILDKILIKIKLRNTVFQFQTGLIRRDILSFNEEVVREALLNAVIHRDYKKHSSVFIKQSPEKIVFKSPGGLPFGITPENIHKKNFWRNRRLAESFEKIGFVERSGQGVDLIFENTIREGKGIPDYFDSDESEVVLNIPAIVKNKEFVSYLDEVDKKMQIGFSVDDLILLETIKSGKKNNIIKKDVQKFLDKGVVVVIGHGRGTKYLLSKEYYKSKDILGEYTKLEGLGRDRIKEMIVKHIKDNGSIISVEVRQAFPELTSKDINNILQELRRSGKLLFRGNPQTGKWFLNG